MPPAILYTSLMGGIHGCRAPHSERHATARLVVIHDLHSSDLALNQLLRADDAAGVELRVAHRRHGAGDIPGALHSVARDHDRRETNRRRIQREIYRNGVTGSDHDGLGSWGIADEPDVQQVAAAGDACEGVATVGTRDGAAAADGDAGADDWLLCVVVSDASANGTGGLLSGERGGPRQCQERAHRTMDPVHTTSRAVNSSRGCLDARVSRRARFHRMRYTT